MIQKSNILKKLLEHKVVAIIRTKEVCSLLPVTKAIVSGGIKALEVSLNTPNALEEIRLLADYYKDSNEILIGAGTVTGLENAHAAIDAGSKFIISPVVEPEVIKICNERGVIAIPGVLTPTEMYKAVCSGADILKVFPASVMGIQYFKAVKAPLPDYKLMAVGGINQKNTLEYLNAGCDLVGIGSALVKNDEIINEEYNKVADDVSGYLKSLNLK